MSRAAATWGVGALGTIALLAWVSRESLSKGAARGADVAQDLLDQPFDFEPVQAARALPGRAVGLLRDWKARVVSNTSQHEGTYHSQNLNKDACGLSFGIIQWSQCTGNLGKLLPAMQQADPAAFERIFGPSWRELLSMTTAGRGSNLGPVDGAVLWKPPWTARFAQAGRHPAFQRVQDSMATESNVFMDQAKQIARLLGADTERSLALFYDRSVQATGSTLKHAKALAESWKRSGAPRSNEDRLRAFAKATTEMWRSFEPRSGNYTSDGRLYWKQVPGKQEWHVWAGTDFDLYEGILRRVNQVLTSRELRDERVDLTV